MSEDAVFSLSHGGSGGLRVAVWELGSGATKRTFTCEAQGGGNALAVLGRTYLLCALRTIPFIYVWHLKKEQVYLKISCPGVVRTLATTPDGVYCAGGIAEKIYIWQVSTGHLLAVVSHHYQPVAALSFTDDGHWLISGGEDARVLVWSLRRILSDAFDSSGISLPYRQGVSMTMGPRPPMVLHTWSDHSLPVTAVHCGAGGMRARVATASLDQTCKLYDLSSGCLLCSVLFGFTLTAVTMDAGEQWLFVGGATGRIAQVNLFLQRTNPSHDVSASTEADEMYKGHIKAVTGLAVSTGGSHLVSSSEDGSCRVWDISSGQATRIQQMKGPVTHSLLCWNLQLPGVGGRGRGGGREPLPPVMPFQKQLHYSREGAGERDVPVVLRGEHPLCDLATLSCEAGLSILPSSEAVGGSKRDEEIEVHQLREDLTQLREVNRRLYSLLTEQTRQHTPL